MKAQAHKKITKKAIHIFKQYCSPDFAKLLHEYGDEIAGGSVEADIFPIFDRATNWHFYQANDVLKPTTIGGITVHPTSDHILNTRMSQLDACIAEIKSDHNTHDRNDLFEDAFTLVGRALHHIQDMSTPSHITPIYHGPDFPFNQVDGALIIHDYFENFSAKSQMLNNILDNINLTQDIISQIQTETHASFLNLYQNAAQQSIHLLFNDTATNFVEGTINGESAQIPLSMFWQTYAQQPAGGKIKGFGSFGPLMECFAHPNKVIVIDEDDYYVGFPALEKVCKRLIHKMIKDTLRGLFIAEKTIPNVSLKIDSITPVYGDNYNKGYIGFTYQKKSIVSIGIAFITRWARLSHIKVSHAFVVTDENECVEAVGSGVQTIKLEHYFNDPNCQVFFRKPKYYNGDVAKRISQAAYEQVGKSYDHSLIPAHFFLNSWVGRWLNRLSFGFLSFIIMKISNSEDQWICSELAAYCLDQQPEYHDQGILLDRNESIDPQELFEDNKIFTPWKNTAP